MQPKTIGSQSDYIHGTCPSCGRCNIGIEGSACTCGRPLPFAFIVPYAAIWDYEEHLSVLFREYRALHLLGRYSGKSPELLKQFAHLEYLYLSRYPRFSFDWLSGFSKLATLELDYINFDNLAGVDRVPSLESLSLTECRKLTNIDAVARCSNLRVLDIAICNNVVSLEPVGECQELIAFRLEAREIADLKFARKLRRLKRLVINARVASHELGPIRDLDLEELTLKRSSFPKQERDQFVREHPNCATEWL